MATISMALCLVVLVLLIVKFRKGQRQRNVGVVDRTEMALLIFNRTKTNMRREWGAKYRANGQQSGHKAWICSSRRGSMQERRPFYSSS